MLRGTRGDRTMQYQAIRQGRFLRRPNRFIAHVALDGGEDGLKFYRSIAKKWKCALKPGGKLIFEVGYDQAQAVRDIMARNGYQDLRTTMDPGMHLRVVEGSAEPS